MKSRETATERNTHLSPRHKPVQERGRKTVHLILDTTARLLEEVGFDGLTTNMIAERAGIPVRSLYRYYPNKKAVIKALGERFDAEWSELGDVDYLGVMADPDADWRAAHRDWLRTYVDHIRRYPGSLAFRRAMRASPDLGELLHEWNRRLAEDFARALEKRGVQRPLKRLEAVGTALFEAAGAILDAALNESSDIRDELLAELLLQSEIYLARHLEPAGFRSPEADDTHMEKLDAELKSKIREGIDCSAFEAEAILATVRETYAEYLPQPATPRRKTAR